MSSLPTIQQNLESYDIQLDNNNQKMQNLLVALFPDLKIPYDMVYQILSFLQDTRVNAQILPRVIRGVHNITIGTGKGQVIIHVRGDMSNVQIREQDDEISTSG